MNRNDILLFDLQFPVNIFDLHISGKYVIVQCPSMTFFIYFFNITTEKFQLLFFLKLIINVLVRYLVKSYFFDTVIKSLAHTWFNVFLSF